MPLFPSSSLLAEMQMCLAELQLSYWTLGEAIDQRISEHKREEALALMITELLG